MYKVCGVNRDELDRVFVDVLVGNGQRNKYSDIFSVGAEFEYDFGFVGYDADFYSFGEETRDSLKKKKEDVDDYEDFDEGVAG